MEKVELVWASGLFEGEGYFTLGRVNSLRPQPQAGLTTTDRDVLVRFHQAVGVGTMTGPYQSTNGKKPAWRWQVSSLEGVQHTVASLWSGLGQRRRERAREVLQIAVQGRNQPPRAKGPIPSTHCKRGHERTTSNTYVWTDGSRRCKDCWKARTTV